MREIPVLIALGIGAVSGCQVDGQETRGAQRDVPLVWVDGLAHRLVVKFADGQDARAIGGEVELDDAAASARLDEVAAAHGMTFSPLLAMAADRVSLLSDLAGADLAAAIAVALPAADRDTVMAAAADLRRLDSVEYVYLEPLAVPPPGDIDPVTDDFTAMQGYRLDGALGADTALAGDTGGAGIKLLDCEYGWDLAHEDLMDIGAVIEPGQTVVPDVHDKDWDDHGTAVLGITSAGHNGYGVSGLIPGAQIRLFPEWTVEQGGRRAAAIGSAILAATPGDVILLEMQSGEGGPAELDPAVWELVDAASAAGITVVGAAGNGAQDLDGDAYEEYRSRGDSGGILVGAGGSTAASALDFSTTGARVNLRGWGENVVTTGYGDLAMVGGDEHQSYTAGFSGTSSASPMVAASAVAVQSAAVAAYGRPLAPRQIRQLLIDTGRPQEGGGHIGPLPDLPAALAAVATVEPEPCDYWTEYWCQLNDCAFCSELPDTSCGDGTCTSDESAGSCPLDCGGGGGECGDQECDAGETPEACPQDCGTCIAANSCGGVAPSGCYCDATCHEHGDCCPDVDVVCD